MRLIFVRHGEPDYENDTLTANGIIQARKTAARLKGEGISVVYSSPMGRAMKTASYTAELFGMDVEILDFMHEIDWDNHPWSAAFRMLTECPELISGDDWRDHELFKGDICLSYYDKISDEFDRFLERFGLIREGMFYRDTKTCKDTVALFAHGGSGAVMFSHLLNVSFPYTLTVLPYGVCSVSIIEFDAKINGIAIPRLELFNDMNHLDNVRLEPLHFEK